MELLARHRYTRELIVSTLVGLAAYAVCALFVLIAERANGRTFAVYKSANALHDLAYAVFYKCSIYNVLMFPLFAWFVPRKPRPGLVEPVAIVLCWVIFDFLNYWTHRMQHSFKPLWALHSVHHSQRELTFLTANRIHAAEQLFSGLLLLIPALLLGISPPHWFPLLMLQLFSETTQHARLDWTFGRLGRLFVSPAFHAVHHSIDASDHHANFGRVFSVWDHLFGTRVEYAGRARCYGLEEQPEEESLAAQFFRPLRELVDAGDARKYDAPVVR